MRRLAFLVLLASLTGAALAQPDADFELRRLATLLDALRQEQQSVYQQFQMTEALQRGEIRRAESGPALDVQEGKAPSYDDAVRARQDRQARLTYYADEMQRLSERYRELGNQAAALVEEIRTLARTAR